MSSHSAAASAVGYLYQVKWALLEVLRAASSRPDQAISLERIEDVGWEQEGDPVRLLQLKHHQVSASSVSDKDDDVWRTIRGWLEAPTVPGANPPDLYLVTTQTAAVGSALEALRPPGRDTDLAGERLLKAARTSTAQGTKATRRRFVDLLPDDRGALVARIHVLDGAPRAEDIDELVRQELIFALPMGHETTFLDLLWAWWYAVALDMLQDRRTSIRAIDVHGKVNDLRDDFTREALPTLVSIPGDEEEVELTSRHADQPFVHQLRWVDTPDIILQKAVVDYYLAVDQTRRWVEDSLIGLHELERFEKRLRDEWQRRLAWRLSKLPVGASEDAKVELGRDLFEEMMEQTRVRVRERYDEPFFARGKYNELADRGRVGWHPDFEERLAELLLDAS